MCRLLGVRADSPVALARDLLTASSSLAKQSRQHADGWGVATFEDRGPKVVRSIEAAHSSQDFATAARGIKHHVVIAHVRKASVGGVLLRNTHPFVHDGWGFAHNGTLHNFETRRARLERAIAPALRKSLRGDTDSERCFLLFLTRLAQTRGSDPLVRAATALASVARWVAETEVPGAPKPSSLNVLCSDGNLFLALRFNRELCFSTTTRATPGQHRTGALLSQLEVASEPIGPRQAWRQVRNATGVCTDRRMRLGRFSVASS